MSNSKIKFYICPNCHKHFSYDTKLKDCDECNIALITDERYNQYLKYKSNKTNKQYQEQQKKKEERVNTIFAIICVIITIFVFSYFISIFASPSEPDTYTCSRCDKTFTDSGNTWSIVYSGFCEKCHDDFEFAREVQDELEKQGY